MGINIGEAFVRVRPDTHGFKSETVKGVGGSFKEIAKTLGAIGTGVGLFEFGKHAVAEAATTQKALEVVKSSFGESGAAMEKFAEQATTALSLTPHLAAETAAALGTLFHNIGIGSAPAAEMSQRILTLGASLSSITGKDAGTVLDALTRALSGNLRGLKQLGYAFTNTQIAAIAFRDQGVKLGQTLTAGQRAIAIETLLTSDLAEKQTEAAAHAGDYANVQSRVTAEWALAKETLGGALLPQLAKVGTSFANFLQGAEESGSLTRNLDTFVKVLTTSFRLLAKGVSVAFGILTRVSHVLGGAKTTIVALLAVMAVNKVRKFARVFEDDLIKKGILPIKGAAAKAAAAQAELAASTEGSAAKMVTALEGVTAAIGAMVAAMGAGAGKMAGSAAETATSISLIGAAARKSAGEVSGAVVVMNGQIRSLGAASLITAGEEAAAAAASATAWTVAAGVIRSAIISTGIGILVVGLGIAIAEIITHWKRVKSEIQQFKRWIEGIPIFWPIVQEVKLLYRSVVFIFTTLKGFFVGAATFFHDVWTHPIRAVKDAFGSLGHYIKQTIADAIGIVGHLLRRIGEGLHFDFLGAGKFKAAGNKLIAAAHELGQKTSQAVADGINGDAVAAKLDKIAADALSDFNVIVLKARPQDDPRVKAAKAGLTAAQALRKQARAELAAANRDAAAADAADRQAAAEAEAQAVKNANTRIRDAVTASHQNLVKLAAVLSKDVGLFLDKTNKAGGSGLHASAEALKRLQDAIKSGNLGQIGLARRALFSQLQENEAADKGGGKSALTKKKEAATQRISDLVAQFNNHKITGQQFKTRLLAEMKKDGIDFKSALKARGIAFADGWKSYLKAIGVQADKISAWDKAHPTKKGGPGGPPVIDPTAVAADENRKAAIRHQQTAATLLRQSAENHREAARAATAAAKAATRVATQQQRVADALKSIAGIKDSVTDGSARTKVTNFPPRGVSDPQPKTPAKVKPPKVTAPENLTGPAQPHLTFDQAVALIRAQKAPKIVVGLKGPLGRVRVVVPKVQVVTVKTPKAHVTVTVKQPTGADRAHNFRVVVPKAQVVTVKPTPVKVAVPKAEVTVKQVPPRVKVIVTKPQVVKVVATGPADKSRNYRLVVPKAQIVTVKAAPVKVAVPKAQVTVKVAVPKAQVVTVKSAPVKVAVPKAQVTVKQTPPKVIVTKPQVVLVKQPTVPKTPFTFDSTGALLVALAKQATPKATVTSTAGATAKLRVVTVKVPTFPKVQIVTVRQLAPKFVVPKPQVIVVKAATPKPQIVTVRQLAPRVVVPRAQIVTVRQVAPKLVLPKAQVVYVKQAAAPKVQVTTIRQAAPKIVIPKAQVVYVKAAPVKWPALPAAKVKVVTVKVPVLPKVQLVMVKQLAPRLVLPKPQVVTVRSTPTRLVVPKAQIVTVRQLAPRLVMPKAQIVTVKQPVVPRVIVPKAQVVTVYQASPKVRVVLVKPIVPKLVAPKAQIVTVRGAPVRVVVPKAQVITVRAAPVRVAVPKAQLVTVRSAPVKVMAPKPQIITVRQLAPRVVVPKAQIVRVSAAPVKVSVPRAVVTVRQTPPKVIVTKPQVVTVRVKQPSVLRVTLPKATISAVTAQAETLLSDNIAVFVQGLNSVGDSLTGFQTQLDKTAHPHLASLGSFATSTGGKIDTLGGKSAIAGGNIAGLGSAAFATATNIAGIKASVVTVNTAMGDLKDDFGLTQGASADLRGELVALTGRIQSTFTKKKPDPHHGTKPPVKTTPAVTKPPATTKTLFKLPGDNPGLKTVGNIDLLHRKVIHLKNGVIATLRAFVTKINGVETLLPSVIDGKIVSHKKAIDHFLKTGEMLGQFSTAKAANEYAHRLRIEQGQFYKNVSAATKPTPPKRTTLSATPTRPHTVVHVKAKVTAPAAHHRPQSAAEKAAAARDAAHAAALRKAQQARDQQNRTLLGIHGSLAAKGGKQGESHHGRVAELATTSSILQLGY